MKNWGLCIFRMILLVKKSIYGFWEHEIFEFPLELKHKDDICLHPYGVCKYGDEEIVFTIWNWIEESSDVCDYFFHHVKNKSWRYFKATEVGSIFSYRETLFPLKNSGLPTNGITV